MKTESEIRKRLAKILADERLSYPPACWQINAPIALIQTALESKRDALRWVLDDKES